MSSRDLVEAIERSIGLPNGYGTIWRRVNGIREFFNTNKGYLLIIDEADKLVSKYTQKKMEILRAVFDQSDVGLVIAGEPKLEAQIKTYLVRMANRVDFYASLRGLSPSEVEGYLTDFQIEPERWYYHCDKLGIIVWQDMVNGGGAYPMWYVTYLTNALQPLMRHAPDGKLLWGFLGRGSAHSREEYARLVETARRLRGQAPIDFPQETAIGALGLYVSNQTVGVFQPMNINFDIIPPLDHRVKGKRNKNAELSQRSLAIIEARKEEILS